MELYLFLMLFVIPLFWYGAANGSHDFLSILCSSVVWGYWLFTGVPFHPLLMGIMLWMVMSVAWTTHLRNSMNDLLMIFALMTVIFAAQSVDKFLVMLFSFIPAAGMAGLEIYQWYKKQTADRRGAFFGNTNHSGIYYVINFFIGLWMAYNVSLLFLPFCILVMFGIMASQCRAAILALCVGMGVVLFKEVGNIATILICTLIGVIAILTQRPMTPAVGTKVFGSADTDYGLVMTKAGLEGRWRIFKKTIKLILERPVWGWGLGVFRKEHQERLPAMATHRVHNDILEILFEIGIIGLAMIVVFFYTLSWNDPFLSAAIVAGIVSSCFFFTFRESHTAAPLMVLCGLSLPPIGVVAVPTVISIVILLAILNILWVHVIKKMVALGWWAKGSFQKDRDSQAKYVEKAVRWYPNTEYISRHSFFQAQVSPEESYNSASQMIYNDDGRVILWEAFDQMARAAYTVGAVNLADYFNRRALAINPNFPKGLKFREGIDSLFKELKENKNGTVAVC